MLRTLISRHIPAPPVARPAPVCRAFHQSAVSFKKKTKKTATEDVPVEAPQVDLGEATKQLQAVVDRFAKHANEAKLGKTNPLVFNSLKIETQDGEVPFPLVAQTSVKGRNFTITVFDPANTQSIINAVLASDLNMNATADPTNKQTLKVPLPPVTTESKKEDVKQLKQVFEKMRNGHSHNKNARTLASIRSDMKSKIQTKKKLTDEESKVWAEYEKIHKAHVTKLSEIFKSAEEAIMK